MELFKITKQIAFKEIFASYSLPTVVGINIEGSTEAGDTITSEYIKDFEEWLNDIDADDFNYSYRRGPLNLLRDNSLNDIFNFFMDELTDYYQEKVADYKERKHKEALEAVLAKAEALQALKETEEKEKKKNTITSDPVIVKINFKDDKNGQS